MKVFIDLFCGLGGASQAFREHPNWKVIAIDNNPDLIPHVHGMILADLLQAAQTYTIIHRLLLEHADQIDQIVVWASPPCTEFSLANPNRPEEPDLTAIDCTKQIISWIHEDFSAGTDVKWVIENVKGAIPWLDDELERSWHQRIGPIYLWGTIPWIDFIDAHHREHKKTDKGAWTRGSRALRPNLRAMVPYAVSRGLVDSFEHQTNLTDFVRLL